MRGCIGRLGCLVALIAIVGVARAQSPPGSGDARAATQRVRDRVGQSWSAFEVANFADALKHAEAASADAAKFLPESDTYRKLAFLMVRLARSGKAAVEGDLRGAKVEADAAVTLARGLSPSNALRAQTLFYAAGFYLSAMKDQANALALYEEVAPLLAKAKPDAKNLKQKQLPCAIFTAFLRADRGDPDDKATRGLAEAIATMAPGDVQAALRPIAREVWKFAVNRALDRPAPN